MKFTRVTKKFNPPLEIPKSHKWLYVKIIVSLIVILCAGYGIYTFFTNYAFRTPIILQSPIVRIKPNVIIGPVASKSAKLSAVFDLGAIVDKIYFLESTSGKFDGCRELGLYNGYGYRQNSFEWVCYSSHEEVRSHVINWLTKNIKDGNIERALCLYNRGLNETDCTYAMNFNSL